MSSHLGYVRYRLFTYFTSKKFKENVNSILILYYIKLTDDKRQNTEETNTKYWSIHKNGYEYVSSVV